MNNFTSIKVYFNQVPGQSNSGKQGGKTRYKKTKRIWSGYPGLTLLFPPHPDNKPLGMIKGKKILSLTASKSQGQYFFLFSENYILNNNLNINIMGGSCITKNDVLIYFIVILHAKLIII